MGTGAKTCAKCGGRMDEGRLVTTDSNSARLQVGWVHGIPERSFWTGLKVAKKDIMTVATYRCTRCGLLENYAE